ncbi:MAG: GNAT family N-acetyltransferase [Flavitalea sp.]
MNQIFRTDSNNQDFQSMVVLLDKDLHERDGVDHTFYAQFNKTVDLKNVVIIYENNEPIGCGAFKPFDDHKVEIKRMYVRPEFRGKGIATKILSELFV